MASTEMNFGPDWLRALQDGMPKGSNSTSASSSMSNSIISNLNSNPKREFPSVKYRYSNEEMLSFYTRDSCYPPRDFMEFKNEEVFVEKVQDPVQFTESTIDEINLLSHSINSDYIMKKAAKENGESANDRPSEFRERTDDRSKLLLNNSGGDMILRKPPGMSGVTASPLGVLAGIFPERGNGHPLRPGRGGNISERGSRTGLRNTASLFSRVSSYDETTATTTTRSNSVTSAALLTTKKVGLQRPTETLTTSSATSIANMFAPAWRTTNTLAATNNTVTGTCANASATEPKSEWRSNSDASKNWRSDSSTANSKANATGAKPAAKDFLDGEESNLFDASTRDYLQRRRGINSTIKPASKPFGRRFDSESGDLFKSKGNFETYDSFDVEDRDLFGGSAARGKAVPAGPNRFSRERNEYAQGNDKWNNNGGKFGPNDRHLNRYGQNQHYQRSNSHTNEDEADRFGNMSGFMDDDDYRRNSSLPEWSLDDPSDIDVTRVGTFDATGAFHEAIEDDAAGGDKFGDDKKKGRSDVSRARPTERQTSNESGRSVEMHDPSRSSNNNGDASSLKKDLNVNNSGRSLPHDGKPTEPRPSQPQTASSMLQLDKPKMDYFNMSDPTLSPNAKPKKGRHNQGDDNFAQLEKDTQQLLSKFGGDEDGNDTTSLLSNQLSKLLKDDSSDSQLKSQSLNQLQLSQNDKLSFMQERFQHSNTSNHSKQSIFSSTLINQIIGREGGSNTKEDVPAELMNQHVTNNSNSHKASLTSMLNDNLSFGPSPTVSSSISEFGVPSSSFMADFESQQTLSSFDSAIGMSQYESLDSRERIGMIQQQRDQLHEPSSDPPARNMNLSLSEGDPTKWYYRDPQGTVQGPFTPKEMYEWFINGYFSRDLLVKRGCDLNFSILGELNMDYPFFQPPFTSPQNEPKPTSGSFLFGGGSLLGTTNLHTPPSSLGPQIVPLSPSFLQSQTSPQLHSASSQLQQASNHLPFGSMVDDLSKAKANNLGPSAFDNVHQPNLKEDDLVSGAPGSSLLNLLQRQHSQPLNQPDSPMQTDNQIANLLGIGPQNTLHANTQLRLILSQLMKNERFVHLTKAQQQHVVMEKFIQLNNHNIKGLAAGNNSNANQFQPEQPSEQYLNQQLPTRPTEQGRSDILTKPHQEEVKHPQKNKLLNEHHQLLAEADQFELHHAHPLPHEPTSTPVQMEANQSARLEQATQRNPLQIIQAAMAAGNNSTTAWENIVPGAMSLSAVEELQRREAEERYKLQQQQQVEQEDRKGEESAAFEHKVERKRQSKGKSADSKNHAGKMDAKPHSTQQPVTQSGKVQVIDSKPVIVDTHEKCMQVPLHSLESLNAQPLNKKSAWGNTATEVVTPSPAMSIAEIQKLQEEKEREKEEKRQQALQQMASFIATQQQQQDHPQANRPPLKWASQKWQEENNSKIKTLTEIQAEEAEKAAIIRAQQEVEAKRRVSANNTVTPLSAIVAKGSSSVWSNPSVPSTQKGGSIWDEDENPTLAAAASMAHSTSGLAKKLTKVDSALIKQILKTSPKNVKKLDESQLSRISIESVDELFRHSVEILSKTFDPIDAHGFMTLVKELSSPNEVVEYMQSYLGNSQSAMLFGKFYISKKSYLFNKSKQENAERAKQQQQQTTSVRQSGIWDEDDEEPTLVNHRNSFAGVNYKAALNQNVLAQPAQKKTSTCSQLAKPKNSNQAKAKVIAQTVLDTDFNIMTVPVESIDEFDNWCMEVLKQNFDQSIDGETLINFLKSLDSPFEITEYVNTYLGISKVSRDFSKNFISKRSYLRNKDKGEQHEDMCGPAPALNPSSKKSGDVDANDNNGFVTVSSASKKKKKTKNPNQTNQPQSIGRSNEPTIHTATLND